MKHGKGKESRARPVTNMVESNRAGLSTFSQRGQGEKQGCLQTWEDEGGSVPSPTGDPAASARDTVRGPFMVPGRWPPLPMLPVMRLPQPDPDVPVPE